MTTPTPKRWIVRTPRGIWSREPIKRLAEAAARDAARAHGSAWVEPAK